jgi:putative transposase
VEAKRKLGRVHARVAGIRSDAIHKATTHLAKTHGQVVIEDLAVAPLARGIRRHRKAWADAAAGEIRRQLTYKTDWYGCDLWLASRWPELWSSRGVSPPRIFGCFRPSDRQAPSYR